MRRPNFLWLILILAATTVVGHRSGAAIAVLPRSAPPLRFTGTTLPKPPMQDQPWSPPANLPKSWSWAVNALYTQGLPDPRGCEYREFDVSEPSQAFGLIYHRGEEELAVRHGWVLPLQRGDIRRFAIRWDGLIYPVSGVGHRADLSKDVDAALRSRQLATRRRGDDPVGLGDAVGPILSCLLLRLGEVELARRTQAEGGTGADPVWTYLAAAGDWADHLFNRAVRDHMRGDDRLSLIRIQTLVRARSLILAEAVRRGAPPQEGVFDPEQLESLYPSLTSPGVDALLADQERRARERAEGTDRPPAPNRIDALIGRLDQINIQASPLNNPASPQLATDPRIQELIKEGEPAVLPLADCLAHDQRLTRSIDYWKFNTPSGRLVPVTEAAYEALREILGVPLLADLEKRAPGGRGTPAHRRALSEAIRNWAAERRPGAIR